jgi:predicted S18 family serine protease
MKKTEMNMDELLHKVNELKKKNRVDLSSDEDLSIALMNLISIEEHLYFSGMKTNKKAYFKMLNTVRNLRKSLLKEIVKEPEGEVWCISKHLLAASMRLIEVGNKHLNKKEVKKAHSKFRAAFDLYAMFWSINLKLISTEEVAQERSTDAWKSKLSALIKKIIDCCKE